MTVRLWFRDGLQTEDIAGDLTEVTNAFNLAKAKGFQFAIVDDADGDPIMLEMQNIIKGKTVKEADSAILGG
jgi:hypothetical protein